MKILYIEWNSIGKNDLEEAFLKEGHSLIYAEMNREDLFYKDFDKIEEDLCEKMYGEYPDIVFTVNYFPSVTNFCAKRRLRYVSWVYDSPYDMIYFGTVVDPCNIIYTLDKEICQEFRNAGISTVHYLPMAANTDRLDAITEGAEFAYDISFIGALYLEKKYNHFAKMSDSLSNYTKGYVDALVAAQLKIQGYNFIEEVLGPVIGELSKVFPRKQIEGNDLRSDAFVCAESVINPWISAVERIDLLEAVAKKYEIDLFTNYKDFTMPNLRCHGFAEYYHQMPLIFKQSRVNLNISRRGMRSGVPLRCFDIMGSGGFLLSNFQSGFLDMFVPGEDFIYYESKNDLLQKIEYFLTHENERQAIAQNGHDKVVANHTYRHRVHEMLDF